MTMQVSSPVPAGCDELRIAAYLADRFTYWSHAQWADLVRRGDVAINGEPANLDSRVSSGDVVACNLPVTAVPVVSLPEAILYADDWMLAVNKPPNLRVHSRGKFSAVNLVYALRQHGYPEASPVNRIDAGTSGLVLFARDADTARALGDQFAHGGVEKIYWGVVHGAPQPRAGVYDQAIGRVTTSTLPHRHAVAGTPGVTDARDARTEYETVSVAGAYALLRLCPVTGRTHQIRVHLAAADHPLVGDALYELDDDAFLAHVRGRPAPPGTAAYEPLLPRPALHCGGLRLAHPHTGAPVSLAAPLPQDMVALLARLQLAQNTELSP
jgi:23S rRNA pseudouridine1911/1915/1917 synthase